MDLGLGFDLIIFYELLKTGINHFITVEYICTLRFLSFNL